MPSLEQMQSVGESCSKYDQAEETDERSCATCEHWAGDDSMCELDIFLTQLESLDQT